jgi:anti-sigma B factor antagonist
MSLRITPIEDGFELDGELDLATEAKLSEVLEPALAAGRRVVLDASRLSFIDSTGLHCLLRAIRSADGRGRLVLVRPSPAVRKVFDLVLVGGVAGLEIQR